MSPSPLDTGAGRPDKRASTSCSSISAAASGSSEYGPAIEISNAVDAMAGGGSLTVRARRVGDQLALSVIDTGHGISPDARKHIFEPFFTTKDPGKGTGLGLAISREIAGALRGRIEVESSPGAGATFTLLFPAPPSSPAPSPPPR